MLVDRCTTFEPKEPPVYQRILAPVDGSPGSLRSLDEAARLARATGAKLNVMHVVNEIVVDPSYSEALYFEVERLRKAGFAILDAAQASARQQGVEAEAKLSETLGGRAADAILEHAAKWGADVIVMGTHGRRGLRRLAMGSDAEFVVRRSPVPVLIVRETPEG